MEETSKQKIRAYYKVAAAHHDADVAAVLAAREQDDVRFYLDIARRVGGSVIEFGAGTGRIGLEIARAGLSYTGVDLSPAMLDVFRAKVESEPEAVRARVRVKEGDLRSTHLDKKFQLAFLPNDVVSHLLTADDRRRALNRLKAHLIPGGLLVFDFSMPRYEALLEASGAKNPKPVVELERSGEGKAKVRRTASYATDPANQRITVRRVWEEVGSRGSSKELCEAELTLRWFHRFELELLLKHAGFEVVDLLGDFDRRPYDGKSGWCVVVARPLPAAIKVRVKAKGSLRRPVRTRAGRFGARAGGGGRFDRPGRFAPRPAYGGYRSTGAGMGHGGGRYGGAPRGDYGSPRSSGGYGAPRPSGGYGSPGQTGSGYGSG